MLFTSCQDDNRIDEPIEEKGKVQFNNEGYTVENGHLSFVDETAIESYINKISKTLDNYNNDELLKSTNSSPLPAIPGFASLASRLSANKHQLKSLSSDDGSEMDFMCEFNAQFIPDEVIHYVVDTANQVKIADNMYQITPFGTFVYNKSDSLEYNVLCETFIDIYKNHTIKVDSVTYFYGNIKFIDSYGKIANLQDGEELEDVLFTELNGNSDNSNSELLLTSNTTLKSASNRIISAYTSAYGLTTYKAGAKTAAGKLVQSAFGENSWREKRLDSQHRMKVKLYNVNYGFFKNQGFRVEYNHLKDKTITVLYFKRWKLRKKTIKLWSYWSSSKNVPEMVVGIDYFQGYTEYNLPLAKVYADNIPNTIVNKINDYAIKVSYDGLIKTPTAIAKNWVTDLNIFKGVVFKFGTNTFNYNEISAKAFDAGMDCLRDEIKGSTNKLIKKQINKASSTPIAVFTPDYKGGGYKEYMILKGVRTYYNESNVHVQIAQPSFGFKIGCEDGGKWKLAAFTPNKFNIDEAYIFGSVKHNGKWQGVRLYIK